MFRLRTIWARFVLVVSISLTATIVLVAGFSVWREASRFAETRTEEVVSVARVMASVSAEAVAQTDERAAFDALRAVSDFEGVSFARLEDLNGAVLAQVGTGIALDSDIEASNARNAYSVLAGRPIIIGVPVRFAGERVGALVLMAQTDALWSRIFSFLGDLALASLLAALIGITGVSLLTRRITAPIKNLNEAMTKVRDKQEFDTQITRISDDETGHLTDAFNEMISGIRDRDQRLQRHRDNLELEVTERTQQYRSAKEEAEKANAAKSDFLATMSHEIRTPMNGMLVMAELLAKAELPGRLNRYAEVINKSGQGLLTIINDILDISKIEAGRMSLEDGRWSPRNLTVDVLDVFHDRAQAKGVELVSYVEADVPESLGGDPVRLRQVVSNLVNNAIKFTDEGAVVVEAKLAGAPNQLHLVVRDTGIGIPPEKCATIFEAFLQADQSTTRQYGGTGLGLAIAKRLVEAMQGKIWVESVVGEGSDFIIELPIAKAEAAPHWTGLNDLGAVTVSVDVDGPLTEYSLRRHLNDLIPNHGSFDDEPASDGHALRISSIEDCLNRQAEGDERIVALADAGDQRADVALDNQRCHAVLMLPFGHQRLEAAIRSAFGLEKRSSASSSQPMPDLPQWPSQRVLVADDSEVNIEVAREALGQFGIKPDCFVDGAAALEALNEATYDLVLMDCSMPVMDGYEATREIRNRQIQSAANAPIPVIALTANASIASEDHWKEAGMNSYLAKPFTLDSLQACLLRWLPEPSPKSDVDHAAIKKDTDERVADPSEEVWAASRDSSQISALVSDDGLQALSALTGGLSVDLFRTLVSLYEDNAPEIAERITQAAVTRDFTKLADAAHALKSMSNNIAAQRLADKCQEIETQAKAGDETAFVGANDVPLLLMDTLTALDERLSHWPVEPDPRSRGVSEPIRQSAKT